MATDVNFNLQDYLEARFGEVREKLDELAGVKSDHELRIAAIEQTHKTVRWVVGVVLVGFFGMIFDLVSNHIPNVVRSLFKG